MREREIDQAITDRLKHALDALQLPINKIARAMGLDRPDALHNAMNGRNYPSFDILLRLSKAFPHLNINYIFGLEDTVFRTNAPGIIQDEEFTRLLDEMQTKSREITKTIEKLKKRKS